MTYSGRIEEKDFGEPFEVLFVVSGDREYGDNVVTAERLFECLDGFEAFAAWVRAPANR